MEPPDILERTIDYSLRTVRLFRELEPDGAGRILGRQLLRSATSIGANLHEGQTAQSSADFIAKLSIAHKESLEALYWLRLISRAEIVSSARLEALIDETDHLARILASILLKTKQSENSKYKTPDAK